MNKLGFKRLWDLPGFTQLFSGIDSWDRNIHAPDEAGEGINRMEPKEWNAGQTHKRKDNDGNRIAKGILPALKSSFENKNKTIDPPLSSSKPSEATIEDCLSLWLSSTFHHHHIHLAVSLFYKKGTQIPQARVDEQGELAEGDFQVSLDFLFWSCYTTFRNSFM